MKLRIFFTVYTLTDKVSGRYSKIKNQRDVSCTENAESAVDAIYSEFGKLGRDDRKDAKGNSLAPMRYAVVHAVSTISEEREEVHLGDPERIYEVPLFDSETLKNCLSRKPE